MITYPQPERTSLSSVLKKILNTLSSIIFPEYCVVCKKQSTPLCQNCEHLLPRRSFRKQNLHAYLPYHDPSVRKLIALLKYKNYRALGEQLGRNIADDVYEEVVEYLNLHPGTEMLITNMPTTKKHLRTRGYNQSEIIAKTISFTHALPYQKNILAKDPAHAPQTTLRHRTERIENAQGSILLQPKADVRGKLVIVIDDVITTGATARAATQALYMAGAKHVMICALAH